MKRCSTGLVRILIGVCVGVPCGIALVLYMVRSTMYYRMAQPGVYNGEYAFIGSICDTEEGIKANLRIRVSMGGELRNIVVFGASSMRRLYEDLARFNRSEPACAVQALSMLQGVPFTAENIRKREAYIDEKYAPLDVMDMPVADYRRLVFYRWLYHVKGKFNEHELEAQPKTETAQPPFLSSAE